MLFVNKTVNARHVDREADCTLNIFRSVITFMKMFP